MCRISVHLLPEVQNDKANLDFSMLGEPNLSVNYKGCVHVFHGLKRNYRRMDELPFIGRIREREKVGCRKTRRRTMV